MLHSRTALVVALVLLFACSNGLTYLWSYAAGLEGAGSKPLIPEAYLVVYTNGQRIAAERIGAEVSLEPVAHGVQVRGYRLDEHREWSEPFLFLVPNNSVGRLVAMSETMVGLYNVEPSPDVEGPTPIKKDPVTYDPTPRFTVDPPLEQ